MRTLLEGLRYVVFVVVVVFVLFFNARQNFIHYIRMKYFRSRGDCYALAI